MLPRALPAVRARRVIAAGWQTSNRTSTHQTVERCQSIEPYASKHQMRRGTQRIPKATIWGCAHVRTGARTRATRGRATLQHNPSVKRSPVMHGSALGPKLCTQRHPTYGFSQPPSHSRALTHPARPCPATRSVPQNLLAQARFRSRFHLLFGGARRHSECHATREYRTSPPRNGRCRTRCPKTIRTRPSASICP